VTKIHSIAGLHHGGGLIERRPFRAPHHTISAAGLVGGGPLARPGEAVLAHHGVLFLDELSEFSRPALDALRQPLEDKLVAIVRRQQTAAYPTRFMLVAATNPCPCGYGGEGKRCHCNETDLSRHRRKLSGPLLDRLELFVRLRRPSAAELRAPPHAASLETRASVIAARERQLALRPLQSFEAMPGLGVRAHIDQQLITVGNRRLFDHSLALPEAERWEAEGKSLLVVARDADVIGVLAAADTLRAEVPAALEAVRALGVRHIELLTGDNERTASQIADALKIEYHANLLPEDKITIVKEYQSKGHIVVMVGDGVNDAPALAQANVGIAMGAAGTDIAIEAAHVALMRDDWLLVPDVLRIAQRTMRVVKMNLGFTTLYNIVGLSLAALGILPPILAAAAQSLPDLGIMANSSRLIRQR